MTSLGRLERYLRAEKERLRSRPGKLREPHKALPFVTISRQAGAGGHSLAAALLDVFAAQAEQDVFGGWQIFDQKLCNVVADDPVFSRSLDALLAEEYRSPTQDFFHQLVRSTVDQDLVMARVFQVVRSLASIGKAIIVGRAGSQVALGAGPGVRLRVVAPEHVRIERMMEARNLNEREARSEARRVDSHRARLLKVYFEADIEDPTGYDAVWNTGSATITEIAEAIVAILRRRVADYPPT